MKNINHLPVKLNRRCSTADILSTLTAIMIVILYPFIALNSEIFAATLSGWFVPDGVTLFETANQLKNAKISDILYQSNANAGEALINSTMVAIGSYMPYVFNTILIFAAAVIVRKNSNFGLAYLVFFVPYYIIALPLPSKDIIVLIMFAIALSTFTGERYKYKLFISLTVCALMFFVRDGFALILAASIICTTLVFKYSIRISLAIICLAFICSSFWIFFETIFSESFLYVRAIGVASQSELIDIDSSTSVSGYFVKLIGNATNLAFRPAIIDSIGAVNLLSFSYWISGVTLLCGFYFSMVGLKSSEISDRKIGLLGLLILIIISITPYVQPRYLLPLCISIPMYKFMSIRKFLVTFCFASAISVAASVIYQIAGNYPERPINENLINKVLVSN